MLRFWWLLSCVDFTAFRSYLPETFESFANNKPEAVKTAALAWIFAAM